MTEQSARSRGFRRPAEWEPHDACFTAWPSHPDLWMESFGAARAAVAELCAVVCDLDPATGGARGERVEVLVLDEHGEADARQHLAGLPIRFHRIPFGDIWVRDTGPAFLVDGVEVRAACFGFNGWGEKYLFEHDAEVSQRIAAASGAGSTSYSWVLEGGAIDVDGEGTAMATRQCLLNPNRGQGLDEATVERRLRDALAIDEVVWLDRGLAGDHTDGHVDMVARFVAPGVVACAEPYAAGDPSSAALLAARRVLSRARDARGRRLEVVALPSPGPIREPGGALMPASYANFYIANTTVAVPTYGAPADDAAIATIAGLFGNRRVVGIDATAVLTGGGAFHCITQQQPRPGNRSFHD